MRWSGKATRDTGKEEVIELGVRRYGLSIPTKLPRPGSVDESDITCPKDDRATNNVVSISSQ